MSYSHEVVVPRPFEQVSDHMEEFLKQPFDGFTKKFLDFATTYSGPMDIEVRRVDPATFEVRVSVAGSVNTQRFVLSREGWNATRIRSETSGLPDLTEKWMNSGLGKTLAKRSYDTWVKKFISFIDTHQRGGHGLS